MRFFAKEVGIALVLTVIISQFVRPTIVFGRSMEPTFVESDCLLMSKTAYDKIEPQRGDVVVFQSNIKDKNDKDELLIKRVVGLPGEEISIRDGIVYVDDKQVIDTVSKDGVTLGDMDKVRVPDNSYFCMGDNRAHSTDSRFGSVGSISKSKIVGKAVFKFYPFKSIGKVESKL